MTLKKAGEIIGNDEPLSKRTISSYITKGHLEAYGSGKGRRVTLRSIVAYTEGKRGIWRNGGNDASQGQATPLRRQTGHGSRTFQSSAAGITFGEVSIPGHTPKPGLTHS